MTDAFPGGLTAPQDWLNGLIPKTPNISEDFLKHETLTVLRDFFMRSHAWRDWLYPITLQPTINVYSAELTDVKAELISVINAYIEQLDTRVKPNTVMNQWQLSPAPPGNTYADTRTRITATPMYYYITPENQIEIFPLSDPSVVYIARLNVSMKPIDLCVPTWIQNKYYNAIIDGVLSRTYNTPGPNYKPDLAARMERRYEAAVSRAMILARTGYTGIQERVPYPNYASGRQRFRGRGRATVFGYRP